MNTLHDTCINIIASCKCKTLRMVECGRMHYIPGEVVGRKEIVYTIFSEFSYT